VGGSARDGRASRLRCVLWLPQQFLVKNSRTAAERSGVVKTVRSASSLLVAAFAVGVLPLIGVASDAPSEGEVAVARAVFARNIAEREPVDIVSTLDPEAQTIFFFSELLGLEGQTVTHEWMYQGAVVSQVQFKVGSPRWRVYSSKSLRPDWKGTWTVMVRDGSGRELHRATLGYGLAEAGPGAPDPTPPASPAREP
jgi:hypothetical protein